jgi:kumamolisin
MNIPLFGSLTKNGRGLFSLRRRVGQRAGLWMALILALGLSAQAASSPPVLFSNSISPVATSALALGGNTSGPLLTRTTLTNAETSATMEIEVALKMRNFTSLQAQINQGQLVSPAVMAQQYEPAASDYQNVVNWLTSAGLSVSSQDPHHLAVFATGTVSQIAKAFQVNFGKVTASGVEYTSAITAPSVPATVASVLVGINGLQPHLRKNHHLVPFQPSSTTGNNPPFLPGQIAKAYSANGLNETGAGQTIAIVIDSVPATSDLTKFWTTCGIGQSLSNIQFIAVGGGTPATDTEGEATLDVEWSSSMAPAAKVRVYAVSDLTDVSLDHAYSQVFNDLPNYPSLHQMSLSYGAAEAETPTSQIETDSQYFAELANAGVTILVSSGDGGSQPDGSRSAPSVETPASDPSVTAVGGTTLHVNATTGLESSETGWSDSGGGISTVFGRPSWQTGAGVPSGTMRLVPDVASDADPNTGGLVILGGKSMQFGGTSLGAPTWAAYCALINQARATNLPSEGSLGFLGPKVYPLIGSSDFRDITSGSNGNYSCGVGYDMVTGIGVPDVANLVEALGGGSVAVTAPSIVTQPAGANVTAGQAATFTVTATGAGALAYQWQVLAGSNSTWSNLTNNSTYSGATTDALTVNATTVAMSGEQFLCVVSNSGGSIASSAATLTVNPVPTPPPAPAPVAPAITHQPQSESVYVGQTASFSATVTGTAPLSYQWKKNGAALTGATNATLVIADAQTTNAGNYTLFVSNSVGNVTSAVAVLTVVPTPTPPSPPVPTPPPPHQPVVVAPSIFQQPHNETVTVGQTAVFGVWVNGTPPFSYQWSKSGVAIAGATNYYLAIPDAQTTNAGNYTVLVSNSAGNVTSSVATLTVNPAPPPVAPAIVRQPQSETVTVGQTAQFGVFASGTGPLSYQWSENGTAIAGATNSVLTIRDVQAANAGNYTVNVSNSVGNVTSSAATLTVNPANPRSPTPPVSGTPPSITTQPVSQTASLGDNVTFSVVASGTGLYYQWFQNDYYVKGATSANLTLTDVQLGASGYYTVVVYNSAGLVWSTPAALTVNLLSSSSGNTSNEGLFFPTGGVPAGLVALSGRDAANAQSWLNQLTQVAADQQAQTATLNQIQANFGDDLSALFTLLSFQNLTDSVDFDTYVAPWLLEYSTNAKVFYVDNSGDIYIQATATAGGATSVASTLELPAEFLRSLVQTF